MSNSLVFDQLYQLQTECGAFLLFDCKTLKHRKNDVEDWWKSDFQNEFNSGNLIAFHTGTNTNFTLKFVQRKLTASEKKAIVCNHSFRCLVQHNRLYWDNYNHLPSKNQSENAEDDLEGWLAVANGDYKVTVYALDWFNTVSNTEREKESDISHYIIQFEKRGEQLIDTPSQIPWLTPSQNWFNQKSKENPVLMRLFIKHACITFDRQLRFAEALDKKSQKRVAKSKRVDDKNNLWSYTTSKALLEINGEKFKALEIGSYADPDYTWLWSWDNQSKKLTAENKKLKELVLKIGEKYGISTCSQGHYFNIEPFLSPELNSYSVDIFAAIICGELNFPAYYKMPFEHGTVLAVIDDADFHFTEPHPVTRMVTVLSQVFIALPISNHREAFIEYAKAYHLETEVISKNLLKVKSADGSELKAEFDQLNRLIEVKAAVPSFGRTD